MQGANQWDWTEIYTVGEPKAINQWDEAPEAAHVRYSTVRMNTAALLLCWQA
jgi:hypothetical protein